LGIFVVLILLLIAFMIYNYERLNIIKNSRSIKKKIPIFNGIYDYSLYHNTEYNTFIANSNTFRDLAPSINQAGGAEYTYNFWLNINRRALIESNQYAEDIILFMRGSMLQIPYKNSGTGGKNCLLDTNGKYILVKNPLIRMKSDGTSIIVEYNTLTNPDAYRSDGTTLIKCDTGKWDDRNGGLLGVYNMTSSEYDNKWFMFTVVIKEITPENDILNKFKTSCKIYLNGINKLDRVVEAPFNGESDKSPGSAAMKHNKSPLHLNPGNLLTAIDEQLEEKIFSTTDLSPLKMADLTYFNYATNENQIKSLFKSGFSKEPFRLEEKPGITYYPIANITSATSNNSVKPY